MYVLHEVFSEVVSGPCRLLWFLSGIVFGSVCCRVRFDLVDGGVHGVFRLFVETFFSESFLLSHLSNPYHNPEMIFVPRNTLKFEMKATLLAPRSSQR